jgi:DUF971 family protein
MPSRLFPSNIQVIGSEIAIAWNDGVETFLPIEQVRRFCPCAVCGGEPDVLGNVDRPEVRYTPESFVLQGWHIVGGYAVQPTWGDGHGSGLYSFDYLRKIGAAQMPPP